MCTKKCKGFDGIDVEIDDAQDSSKQMRSMGLQESNFIRDDGQSWFAFKSNPLGVRFGSAIQTDPNGHIMRAQDVTDVSGNQSSIGLKTIPYLCGCGRLTERRQ